MRITEEIENVKKIMEFDKYLLPHVIADALAKHDAGEKLTDTERMAVGLRYSEFLADQNKVGSEYDEELWRADNRARIYRDKLGVTMEWLIFALKQETGLC